MSVTDLNLSASGTQNPAAKAAAVVNGVPLVTRSRALYIGVSGDLTVTMADGNIVTFKNVVQGTVLPLRILQAEVSTTATNIIALF